MIFVMVLSCFEVEVLFYWLWAKCCDFAGMKKLGWYSAGRVRASLVLNRFSHHITFAPSHNDGGERNSGVERIKDLGTLRVESFGNYFFIRKIQILS